MLYRHALHSSLLSYFSQQTKDMWIKCSLIKTVTISDSFWVFLSWSIRPVPGKWAEITVNVSQKHSVLALLHLLNHWSNQVITKKLRNTATSPMVALSFKMNDLRKKRSESLMPLRKYNPFCLGQNMMDYFLATKIYCCEQEGVRKSPATLGQEFENTHCVPAFTIRTLH